MDILALYDIHGNVDALNAVLADPCADGPDAVLIGGDTVPGALAAAALDRLAQLTVPVHWVRGNGEREVALAERATGTAAFTAQRLGFERAHRLGEMPLTVELDGVLFCHASPRRDDEMLTLLSSHERWAAALAGVTVPLVVAGHTHQQDDRMVGDVRFVNAGSVGLPYEGDGAARWLWIADGVPEPRVTEYDWRAAGARLLAAGYPDRDSIEASLGAPLPAVEVTRVFEASVGSSPEE